MTPTAASISDWPPEVSTLLTFLANDDRPTLVLKLPQKPTSRRYYNNALSKFLTATKSEIAFESWVGRLPLYDIAQHDSGRNLKAGRFGGGEWSATPLTPLYIAVSCQTGLHLDHRGETSNGRQSRNSSASSQINDDGDYLLRIPQLAGDPYAMFFTQYAWHETELGPIRDWHPILREHIATILVCPNPRVAYWGPTSYQLYNEAAVPMMGNKHPVCLGHPITAMWGQIINDQVTSTFSYTSLDLKNMPITDVEHNLERDGYTEEVYFTYTTLPFCDSDGNVVGHMLELAETTDTVLMRERTAGKNKAMEIAENMNSPVEAWQQFKAFLQPDAMKDVCYAMLFNNTESRRSVRRPLSQTSNPSQLNSRYSLQHHFGIPDHEAFRKLPELLASTLNFNPTEHKMIVVLQTQSGNLPESLALNVSDRGIVNTVCLFTLLDNNDHPLGFAVLGMNPRRRFDEDSRLFMQSLRDIFARRTELLSRPDEDRTDDMVHMYREAPIGLYKLRLDGHPVFINDKYLELMGLRREDYYGPSGNFVWADAVFEEDRPVILDAWETVVAGGSGAWEFRTKAHGPQVWLESRAFIELDDNNNPIGVYGWLSDVSHRKLTEKLMSERLSDALETKNAAIQFIDIVSHEMRNPLSSILQLTDSILTTIKPLADDLPDFAANSIIDAADTINLCAQHQKTIVDDILTLSKLDSKLVVLSPDVVKVGQVLNKIIRMVEVDLERSKIDTTIKIDESCTDLSIEYVSLDSGRLLQILLNLLTNAIKFTQHQLKTRRIQITLSASRERPDGKTIGVEYIEPRDQGNMQNSAGMEQDNPEDIWLQYSVADTGLGMTEEETTHLFYRFSQASPKTYKQYGGSGLGLFICRELAELHGGRIGFHSEYGMGTKFAFYIKAKRADPPPPSMDDVVLGNVGKYEDVSIKDLHVLLVEDNAINQRVMAQQLRRTGCSVDVADNGEEALNYLASTVALLDAPDALPISVILMDVEMPIMDGLTCTRKIREMELTGEIKSHLPIAGITANSRQEQITTAQDAGMDDVITKPFRISDIVPRIEALAAKWPFPV